jgi:hypothetical protein
VDDLDHLLTGIQALKNLGAHGPLADARHEVLDHAEVDVGLEQGEPDLAQRGIDVRFGHPAAAGQAAEDASKSVGKIIEHGRRV